MESLSRINEGIRCIGDVTELACAADMRSLCLHGNGISRIEGLEHLTGLSELNLSSNSIASIEGLDQLASLTSLNLATNRIRSIDGLSALRSLARLNLAHNAISDAPGLAQLQGTARSIAHVNLQGNQLSSVQQLAALRGCPHLSSLLLAGNPLCGSPSCAADLRALLPHLQHTDLPVAQAQALQAAYPGQHQLLGGAPYPAHQQQLGYSPHMQQQMGPYAWQHPQHPEPRHPDLDGRRSKMGALDPQQATAEARRRQGDGEWGEDSAQAADQRAGAAHPRSRARAAHTASASTQTASGASELLQLSAEADALRQQLAELARQLEAERAGTASDMGQLQQRLGQELDEALRREQRAASQQVEEGYQEASFAVSRAL
jgi:hypothetical protein